jgi:hypothetical protein
MTDSAMCGQYPMDEVLSALRKSVKLRRLDDAIFWLTVLLEKGPQYASKIAARQLLIVASEDLHDESVMGRALAVYQTVQVVTETDSLYWLTARMCDPDVPRWWESEQAREVDRLWSASIGELKRDPRPVPSYALDRHTKRGWQVKRDEGWFDDRFSGTDLGRAKTAYLFRRDGFIDADSRLECDRDGVEDHGFWSVWRQRKQLQGDDLPDRPPDHEPEQVSLLDEGEEV